MTGGSGSAIGQAARELMEEMQKAQRDLQKLEQQDKGVQGSGKSFGDAMQAQMAQATQQINPTARAHDVIAQAKIEATQGSKRVNEAAQSYRSWFASSLENLVGGQDKMTELMNLALSGRQFSSPELIAMQAGVYRYAQELELTSKVVEKATSGIKQTMNTQV